MITIAIKQERQTWITPTSGEEGTSPKTWIATVDIAIDNGLKLGLTVCRHTKFTGPCSRKLFKNTTQNLPLEYNVTVEWKEIYLSGKYEYLSNEKKNYKSVQVLEAEGTEAKYCTKKSCCGKKLQRINKFS